MSALVDNSGSGNSMILTGSAEVRKETPSWNFAQKLVPTGLNARNTSDSFGTIMDQDGTTLVVGTPQHPYDSEGLNPLASAGSIWVYQRSLAPASRPVLAAAAKTVFAYTGSNQTFTVPAGVYRIRVKAWGAGGGGGPSFRGGAGGYAEGEIAVEPGEVLTIIVGGGGYNDPATNTPYGGGGARTYAAASGGSGGGRSGVRRAWGTDNEIITAGAGGGGSFHSAGGAGGGLTATAATGAGGYPGGSAGTQETYGSAYHVNGYGAKFTGGANAVTYYGYGGSGGGGYWGGGGGSDYVGYGTGGGGGSSFVGGAINGIVGLSLGPDNVYRSWDSDYAGNVGVAGAIGSTRTTSQGGHGLVVLGYTGDTNTLQDSFAWSQVARIVPEGMNARNSTDQFGTSVSVSNDWIAVGAPFHDWDEAGTNQTFAAGAVFMYQLVDNVWTFRQKVLAAGTNGRNSADSFGASVSLRGNILVVGAPLHEFNATGAGSLPDAGAVFVFVKDDSGTWTFKQKLAASGSSARNELDNFGTTVALDGTRIAVGAPNHVYDAFADNALDHAGAAWVYEQNPDTLVWSQSAKLVSATRTAGALFGATLALRGNTIAVGSKGVGTSDVFYLVNRVWVNQDTRTDTLPRNSSTTALLRFNNSGVLNAAAPSGNQPTVSGTALTYSTDKARFARSSLLLNGASPSILTMGTQGQLPGLDDFTLEMWINHKDSAYTLTSQLSSGGAFSLPNFVADSNGWSFSLRKPDSEYQAGNLFFNYGSSDQVGVKQFKGEFVPYVDQPTVLRPDVNPGLVTLSGSIQTVSSPDSTNSRTSTVWRSSPAANANDVKFSRDGYIAFTTSRAGTVTVRAFVQSEIGCDWISLFLDGVIFNPPTSVNENRMSGNNWPWQDMVISNVPAGSHSIRINYTTDGSAQSGFDGGAIASITIPASTSISTYVSGDIVTVSGARWQCAVTGTKLSPASSNSDWTALPARIAPSTVELGIAQQDAWEHIAVVRQGTLLTFFRNGTRVARRNMGAGSLDTTGILYFGSTNYKGLISDFRISKEAKYTADFTPSHTPFQVGDPASVGRGTALALLDDQTVLVGLPKLSGMDPVGRRSTNEAQPDLHVDSTASASEGGLVQTLTRSGLVWDSTVNIAPAGVFSSRDTGDAFGSTVIVRGNRVAVAAPLHGRDFHNQDYVAGAGAVFAFSIDGDNVRNTRKILPTERNTTTGGQFGRSLDLVDSQLVVSSPAFVKLRTTYSETYSQGDRTNSGYSYNGYSYGYYYYAPTYNYRYSNYSYQLSRFNEYTLLDSGTWQASRTTLNRSGNTTASANYSNTTSAFNSYPAYSYTPGPFPSAAVDITNAALPLIGANVNLRTSTSIVLSAPGESVAYSSYDAIAAGAVRVQTLTGSYGFSLLGVPGSSNNRGASDTFGTAVGTNGTQIVVGAPGHAYDLFGKNSTTRAGAVYSYVKNSENIWTVEQKILSPVRNTNTAYGTKLAMSSAGFLVNSQLRNDLFVRQVNTTAPWRLEKSITSYSSAEPLTSIASVNSSTFVTGIPQRDNTTVNLADTGDAMVLRNDVKPVTSSGAASISTTTKKFGPSSVYFADGTGVLTVPKCSDWRFGNDYTVEYWINTTGVTGNHFFHSGGGSQFSYLRLYTAASGKLGMHTYNTNTETSSVAINDGVWHHIAASKTGGSLRVFVDGVIVWSGTSTVGADAFSTLLLGQNFVGYMDDLRIVTGVSKYNAAFAPPTTALPMGTQLDPNWSNTVLAMPMDGDFRDRSVRWWINEDLNDSGNLNFVGTSNGRNANDNFGKSVSLGNNILAVGVPGYDFSPGGVPSGYTDLGGVHMFAYVDQQGEWYAQTQLSMAGTLASSARMGEYVNVQGNYVVAGTPNTAYSNGGQWKVWNQTRPGVWVYQAQYQGVTAAYDTMPVLMTEDVLVTGAPGYGYSNTSLSGAFITWTRTGSTWNIQPFMAVPMSTNGRFEYNALDYSLITTTGKARNANDQFGFAVRINNQNDLLTVGAPYHAFSSVGTSIAGNNGAVFSYYWDSTLKQWRFQTKFVGSTASASSSNALFGSKLDMRDGYLVVNQQGANITPSYGGFNQFYTKTGSGVTGSFVFQTEIAGTVSSEYSGNAVTLLSNSFAALGSPQLNSTTVTALGAFRSVSRSSALWSVGAYNRVTGNAYGRMAGDTFGTSVALYNGTLLVGTPRHRYTSDGTAWNTGAGAVFVFNFDSSRNTFLYSQRVVADNFTNGYFGNSIDFRANTAVVSGLGNSRTTVMSRTGGTWSAGTAIVGSEGQGSNGTVIDDNRIILGMPLRAATDPSVYGAPSVSNAGAWRALDKIGATWTLGNINVTPSFDHRGTEIVGYGGSRNTSGYFGRSVSIGTGGTLLAVGASNQTTNEYGAQPSYENTGYVFIYSLDTLTGKYVFNTNIQNPGNNPSASETQFGYSVDLENDRLLVSAIGDNRRGAIYSFKHMDPGVWTLEKRFQQGIQTDFGQTAVFVKDSSVMAVSMPTHNNYPLVTASGRVYTQKLVGDDWLSIDAREGGQGQNLIILSANANYNPGAGGGGGSGAIGGGGGAVGQGTLYSPGVGGLGGSNLVPPDCASLAGLLTIPAQDSDPDRGGAGSGAAKSAAGTVGVAANSGAHARIVLSWNSSKSIFDYTGADQTFLVPPGVTTLNVKMWGAGGGAAPLLGGTGGAGGFVLGTMTVVPGETLTIIVGKGGLGGVYTQDNGSKADLTPRYGGGGLGGINNGAIYSAIGNGGNGGGRAEIARGTVSVAIAGGGGGGGSAYATSSNTPAMSNGQPGGANNSGASRNRFAANASTELNVGGNINGRNSGDQFGLSVAQDKFNNILVGAPYHNYDENSELSFSNRGAVFAFTRDPIAKNSTYNRRFNGVAKASSLFGTHLDVLDDRVLVGASQSLNVLTPGNAGGSNVFGSLDFFQYQQGTRSWLLESRLDGVTPAASGTNYYKGVLVTGDRAVVGLPLYNGSATAGVGTVNSAGAFDTITRNGTAWTTQARTVAGGLSFGRFTSDNFGYSVKLGTGWLAVGASNHNYNESGLISASNWGAIFTFRLDGNTNTWVYETKLNAPTVGTTGMGSKLNLLDTTLSSFYYNASNVNGFVQWQRDANSGVWSALPTATMNNANSNYSFARISNNQFAIGKPTISVGLNGQPSVSSAGTLGFLNLQGNLWSFTDSVLNVPGSSNGRLGNDQFGYSVFTNGSYIAVGAPNQNYNEIGNPVTYTGAVYVFNQPGASFGQEWRLERKLNTAVAVSQSAYKMSGVANQILVGNSSSNTASELWQRVTPGVWRIVNTFTTTGAGTSVATLATPDMVVLGSPNSTGATAGKAAVSDSGTMNTFVRSGATWSARTSISEPGTSFARNTSDWFGYSVALSRNYLLVGAPNHSYDVTGANQIGNAGAAFLYTRVGNTYNYLLKFTAPDVDRVSGFKFGSTVSIDELNTYLAVGSGAVNLAHVFSFDGARVNLMNRFTPGSTALTGTTVSINNGRLAVGVPSYNGVASGLPSIANAGAVFVYRLNSSLTNWDLVETNSLPTRTAQALHGAAVSVSRTSTLLMGAPGNATTGSISIKYVP